MAKKRKGLKANENEPIEELASIEDVQPIETLLIKEVFKEEEKPVEVKEVQSVFKEEKPIEVKEEVQSVFKEEKPIEVKEVFPPPLSKTFYNVTIKEGDKEKSFYTREPLQLVGVELTLTNSFEKITLHENILNKRKLTLACSSSIKPVIRVSLVNGVHIQTSEKEAWMEVQLEIAKKLFNERVLKAYREVTTQLTNEISNQTTKQIKPKIDEI